MQLMICTGLVNTNSSSHFPPVCLLAPKLSSAWFSCLAWRACSSRVTGLVAEGVQEGPGPGLNGLALPAWPAVLFSPVDCDCSGDTALAAARCFTHRSTRAIKESSIATAKGGRLTTKCSIHVLQKERGSSGKRAASHICMVKANGTDVQGRCSHTTCPRHDVAMAFD